MSKIRRHCLVCAAAAYLPGCCQSCTADFMLANQCLTIKEIPFLSGKKIQTGTPHFCSAEFFRSDAADGPVYQEVMFCIVWFI